MPSPEEIQFDMDKTVEYEAQQDVIKNKAATAFAHFILDEILGFIRPGITENEVRNFALSRFEAHNVERPWHPPYVRFGEHTLFAYHNKAKDDLTLRESDIAFADIGIVKDGVEGDAGRSVSFGDNPVFSELQKASQDIFHEGLNFWRDNNPNGVDFHSYILARTAKRGFRFNLDPAGHLIGTFPHRGWKRGLNSYPGKPAKGVWILEVQIRHPELPCGAFFEDILL